MHASARYYCTEWKCPSVAKSAVLKCRQCPQDKSIYCIERRKISNVTSTRDSFSSLFVGLRACGHKNCSFNYSNQFFLAHRVPAATTTRENSLKARAVISIPRLKIGLARTLAWICCTLIFSPIDGGRTGCGWSAHSQSKLTHAPRESTEKTLRSQMLVTLTQITWVVCWRCVGRRGTLGCKLRVTLLAYQLRKNSYNGFARLLVRYGEHITVSLAPRAHSPPWVPCMENEKLLCIFGIVLRCGASCNHCQSRAHAQSIFPPLQQALKICSFFLNRFNWAQYYDV